MRIGIIADTHDKFDITRRAIQRLQELQIEALFHCGDLMSPAMLDLFRPELPTYLVFGNNDKQRRQLVQKAQDRGLHHLGDGGCVMLQNRSIAITHGHLKTQVNALLKTRADVLLLGHSHQKRSELQGKTWIVNPGALHRVKVKTCALMDLESRQLDFLELPSGSD